jgi:hypothetical protein
MGISCRVKPQDWGFTEIRDLEVRAEGGPEF